MKISAICSDIDGTLLDNKRQLSSQTIQVVKSLENKIPFILASARMPSALRHLQQELDILHQPLICYNGGYIVRYENEKPVVLDSVQIAVSICSSILEFASGKDIHISLYQNDTWYAPALDAWAIKEELVTKVSPVVKNLGSVLSQWQHENTGAHKIMCMGHERDIDFLQEAITKVFSGQLNIYRSSLTYLEIAPLSISKASALKLLMAKQFNISLAHVMAFGDNYNDVEMIREVGLGIAVNNARAEVKAVAKEITLKSIEDGVAVAIEKWRGSIVDS